MLAIPIGPFTGGEAGRVRLNISVYRWNRQDPDNAVASVKPLIDALVERGWLSDDSPRWLELAVREEIDRGEQRTEVEWMLL